jgi:transcriptional regulator
MYTPGFNHVSDRGLLIEAMQTWSFAVLFGPENTTDLVATHLPLVVKDEGPHGLLEGHFARANRHLQTLAGDQVLAVFSGPHSYISPSLYVDPLSVPTWNYIAVHAYQPVVKVQML